MNFIALPDLTEGRTPHWPDDFGGAHAPADTRKFEIRRPNGLNTRYDNVREMIESALIAHSMMDDDAGGDLILAGPGLHELHVLAMKTARVAHSCLTYGVSYDEDLPGWVRLLSFPDVRVAV